MSDTNTNIASSSVGGDVVSEEAIRKAMLETKEKLKVIPMEIANPEEFLQRSTQDQARYLQNNGFEERADDEPESSYDEQFEQAQEAQEEVVNEGEKKKKRRYTQSERRAIAEERENRLRIEAELEHERLKNNRLQAQIAQERSQLLDARQKQLEMEEYKMSLARQGALEEGDYRTEAKTNETLLDLRLEKKQLEYERQQLLNHLNNANQEENEYHQQQYYEPRQQPRLTREQQIAQENYYSWVDRHPELDRENSNDYSRDAERLASELSSKLSIRYKRSGLGDQIYSEQYFNDLDQLYDRELGFDSDSPSYSRSPAPKTQSRYVSPVRGSGNSMSGLGSVKRAGTLSDAERRIAENFGRHLKELNKNVSTDKIVDFYKRMKRD